ncbi:uncharacterized protein isoform X9 [Rhodnius prolixus]|uniref:uncharacterized protein isoform X9 n=1 Tax=Rhodnius prolixus TaxID=13249 RepID=UPI003D189C0A
MKYLIVIALLCCYAYTIYAKNVEADKVHGGEDGKAVDQKKEEDAKGDKKKEEDAKGDKKKGEDAKGDKKKGEDAKGDKKKLENHKQHKGKTGKGKKSLSKGVICQPPKVCKVNT